ncbi:MAG: hypothetical protein HC914_22145, partial [Chloroflexaceae bacterium]|nr:hypothetical protein [Chloroflexaceae bacterium]
MTQPSGMVVGQVGSGKYPHQVVQVVAFRGGVVLQQRAAAQQGEGIGYRGWGIGQGYHL